MLFAFASTLTGIIHWVNEKTKLNLVSVPANMYIILGCFILFGLAYLIYEWKCPQEIKNYGNRENFLQKMKETDMHIGVDAKAEIVYANRDAFLDETIDKLLALKKMESDETDPVKKADITATIGSMATELHPAAVHHSLEKQWSAVEHQTTWSITCGILLLLCFGGFITMGVINVLKFF